MCRLSADFATVLLLKKKSSSPKARNISSLKLKQMRDIQCVYKLVTFGYIRRMEKTMLKLTIPMAIFYKIFCFVYPRLFVNTLQ